MLESYLGMSLPPYDNKEYRYRHSDADRRQGLAKVAELLGLADVSDQPGVLYDLSFYSGGIGVYDQLAVTLPVTAALWRLILDARPARPPEELEKDAACSGDFLWLVRGAETSLDARKAAMNFINAGKREFQIECRPADRILFSPDSTVNYWFALWGTDALLNCLAFDQG
jgi:hypothetical protein